MLRPMPWVAALALAACGGGTPAATTTDGGTCASISTSSYDQSCTESSDCVAVPEGNICLDECACTYGAISESAVTKYQSNFPQLGQESCPCTPLPPTCQSGVCTPGSSASDAGGD
jgi:hypothetical protein